ncbi:MAG TPA: hypothetical protein VJ782_02785 [Aeromicrobium sp.]|nr:hypothetical protein [Aeromicrobium sp.]
MGLKALWLAFGGAVGYVAGFVLVPIVVVVLRNGGMEISDGTAANLTRLAALLTSALGGALGVRHAQKAGRSR